MVKVLNLVKVALKLVEKKLYEVLVVVVLEQKYVVSRTLLGLFAILLAQVDFLLELLEKMKVVERVIEPLK